MALKPEYIKQKARERTRNALATSQTFANLDHADQLQLYSDIYQTEYNRLLQENGGGRALAREMADSSSKKAGDLIDDTRHQNVRIEQAGELAGEFIEAVDFPGFVRDLLKAVFDANLEVTLQQMETFKDLLKTAASSISKFVREIDNTAAFGYLVENNSDDFNLDFDDLDKDENGNPKPVLKDKDGNEIARGNADIGDNQLKVKIMDAKIAMAKEHRALLREMILMGVTRLVVEKGTIKASVLFDMKATEKIKKADKAAIRESQSVTKHFGGGLFGFIGGGDTETTTTSQISVSSVKTQADTSLAAKMAGSVEIIFKSDYFKLDNFATMYAPQVTEADRKAATQKK